MARLLLAIAVAAAALVPASAQAPDISRVAWLTGCWALTDGDRSVEENWMAPRGGVMIGSGRTVRGGVLADYELVVLRQQNGRLVYEAHPANQTVASFTAITVTASSVVFENPQHDFPQRVGYERRGDALTAWVEGTTGGRTRRLEFPYQRVTCAQS